jgi:hypothetical protein
MLSSRALPGTSSPIGAEIAYRNAEVLRCGTEALVSCDQHHIGIGDFLHRGEVHGVITSKVELLGQIASSAHEAFGDFDHMQLVVESLECSDGPV